VKVLRDGRVAIGGVFTSAGGSPNDAIAIYNPVTDSFDTPPDVGSTSLPAVWALEHTPQGLLYMGGEQLGDSEQAHLAIWDGQNTTFPTDQPDDRIAALHYFEEEDLLYIGGFFEQSSQGLSINHIATFNGQTFNHIEADIPWPSAPTLSQASMIRSFRDRLYLALSTSVGGPVSGTATFAEQTTISNAGSARAYPRFVITRSGGTGAELRFIRNETTGDVLRFSGLNILDGETITIELRPGKRGIRSPFRGALDQTLIPDQSNFGTFSLLPGDNQITIYIVESGSPTLTAHAVWNNRFWSVEGAG
jgi:hypothetical protein